MSIDSFGVSIRARTVSEAWERAVVRCWTQGHEAPTEYGEISKEILGLMIIVEKPFDEPRVHRGDINVATKDSLQKYINEVLYGNLDWAVEEGKIHYTYHERLFCYPPAKVNQIDFILKKLSQVSFSRRAQAIVWDPERDLWVDSPPCLQRIWCTIRGGRLVMHTTWRSRDIFRAMHMNMLAMTELQRMLAEKLRVDVGPYLDFSNSAHIYEKTYRDVERFIKVAAKRSNQPY
ncbi:MAG: thymidylate synthase [Nitrososphaerota archaeon]|nr:thymidylate synthase [Candidatus Bathyarchaeota archaeon]MDW8048612.1 thymidylate synthase [Nitrososphaerota archaeon]